MELKNDISVRGTLKSVDQYLNIKLDDISVVEELKYPHLVSRIEHRKEYKRRNYVLDIEKILAYMLRVGRRQRTAMLTHCFLLSELGQERLHPRQRSALRPSARERR